MAEVLTNGHTVENNEHVLVKDHLLNGVDSGVPIEDTNGDFIVKAVEKTNTDALLYELKEETQQTNMNPVKDILHEDQIEVSTSLNSVVSNDTDDQSTDVVPSDILEAKNNKDVNVNSNDIIDVKDNVIIDVKQSDILEVKDDAIIGELSDNNINTADAKNVPVESKIKDVSTLLDNKVDDSISVQDTVQNISDVAPQESSTDSNNAVTFEDVGSTSNISNEETLLRVKNNDHAETLNDDNNIPTAGNESALTVEPSVSLKSDAMNELRNSTERVETTESVYNTEDVETTAPVGNTEVVETTGPVHNTEDVETIEPVHNTEEVETTEPVQNIKLTKGVETTEPLHNMHSVETIKSSSSSSESFTTAESTSSSESVANVVSEPIINQSVDEHTSKPAVVTSEDVEITKGKHENTLKVEDEWMDILGNGLLKKKVLREGNGRSSRPIAGDIVNIRCVGKLDDGTVVDQHDNLEFILSDEDVIQAFDLAVALMEDKETATLYTHSRYAYGINGRPNFKPAIPQNADITYEIELLSTKAGPDATKLSSNERVSLGDKKRNRGNDLYMHCDFAGSINAYKRGLKYLDGSDDSEVKEMRIKCLNNLSAAQLKVKAYAMSIQSLEAVLQLEPNNVKALFRKGKCLDGLGKEEEALTCMKQASMIDPLNKTVLQELGRLRSRVAVTHQKEKQIYQRMFQQKPPADDALEEGSWFWPLAIGTVVAAAGGLAGLVWYKQHR